jgi:hypothetical protein
VRPSNLDEKRDRVQESIGPRRLIGRSKAEFASDRSKNIPRGLRKPKPWDLQRRAKRRIRAVRARPFLSPQTLRLRRRGLGAPHTDWHRRAHRSRSLARRTNRKRSSRAAPFASPHALDSNDGHLRHPGGCRPRGRLLPEGARGISAPLQAARRPQARYAIAPHPPSRASNPRTFGSAPIETLARVAPAPTPIRRSSAPAASHGEEAGSANEARRLDPPAPSTIASARTVRTP